MLDSARPFILPFSSGEALPFVRAGDSNVGSGFAALRVGGATVGWDDVLLGQFSPFQEGPAPADENNRAGVEAAGTARRLRWSL